MVYILGKMLSGRGDLSNGGVATEVFAENLLAMATRPIQRMRLTVVQFQSLGRNQGGAQHQCHNNKH